MSKDLISLKSEISQISTSSIAEFLNNMGLPSDNIIASDAERGIVNSNLPTYIASLPEEVKRDARYLSKYVVGAGLGLFDYSLNSIWNEVTIALRNKAIAYGLDIFYDAAVGGKLRDVYSTESDLAGLKDITLLDTCKKLELISETTYKKLAHILDMRNDIGISHPTNYTIQGFELLSWLQTCIQEVLQDKPSDAALQIKAFIDNLKTTDDVLDQKSIANILPKIGSLSSSHCSRILQTLFGLYVADNTTAVLKKNITLLIPTIWDASQDELKYKLGIKLEGYKINLHRDKHGRGEEFFDIVKGNAFKTKSEKTIALSELTEELVTANSNWDNYYHEVPIINKILTYIGLSKDLPNELAQDLISIVLKARIGKGLSHQNGVSPKGKPLYDTFLAIIGEDFFPELIIELESYKIRAKIRNKIAIGEVVSMLKTLKEYIVTDRYLETLDYLIDNFPSRGDSCLDNRFRKMTSTFINWG
ncbi:hypothetical protein [Sphingobacterium sp.]|uniref:hypothetical protein n=1 Tax=Sphingobacterium sp. TaxID=341027 RepID=UPI0028B194D2|nr:hypothetical protein [Sphingobacterium sp.]